MMGDFNPMRLDPKGVDWNSDSERDCCREQESAFANPKPN
jgi:hypothetical protein